MKCGVVIAALQSIKPCPINLGICFGSPTAETASSNLVQYRFESYAKHHKQTRKLLYQTMSLGEDTGKHHPSIAPQLSRQSKRLLTAGSQVRVLQGQPRHGLGRSKQNKPQTVSIGKMLTHNITGSLILYISKSDKRYKVRKSPQKKCVVSLRQWGRQVGGVKYVAVLGRTSIYTGVSCSAPLGRRNRVESHATEVPKGLLPDLIARRPLPSVRGSQ